MKKFIPTENITLFRSCLVSAEYPGIEASTKYVFDKLGVEYVIDRNQSCCTGLGHYYDIFDELSTTALAARNFSLAIKNNHKQYVPMCATCYAILKTAAKTLNEKDEVREHINRAFQENGLEEFQYTKGDINPSDDITHVVDVLYYLRDKIPENKKRDISGLNIATHHGCHYCKIHHEDTLCGYRNPEVIDKICEVMDAPTIGWYDQKPRHCGGGFRQRYANRELSLDATVDKFESLHKENVDLLLVMCPNCHLQFDRYEQVLEEKTGDKHYFAVLNIAQLVALYMGADPYKILGIQTHTVNVEPLLDKLGIDYDSREDTLHVRNK
ncbi:MAG: CoB--CoM heterodisulfide reductase iron-sulfur subunit B family protein [Methanosphaera sp.]|uniref:ferredoxin:CoB-CoM heterodisulfide reductase subunit HdrB n=1 Tax=Methanosphaera sp. ISO3-F5 TaxID=1452353 RepID=UPI002B2612FA|nr:ferredoxin:CoB-CoM heterodisulfide reductase subunit HdrB [Methanosphaera sp. ISO3-F5]MBR0471631.1 CoB--CoM heterodisulfide reductase iron-sulfur subunit B family protein [Methanosphaera sp.]WQH65264.1 CoB--CoM heterodisulfide reductase iron-sulfur subunit B family protein [Methanosphaera sp. ISO3-F5]